MKKTIYTKNSKRLSQERCDEWGQMIFSVTKKIWMATFLAEVFLFLFFKPNAQCSRGYYFYLFIVRPTVAQTAVALACSCLLRMAIKSKKPRWMSLCTILNMSLLSGIVACVHTSVELIPIVLLLPMLLTPLYRDKVMTAAQLLISSLIYILDRIYFIPNSPYMPPMSTLIDVTVFFSSAFIVYCLIEQVNVSFILQDERANRDSLTHLYNHETFYEELEYYMNAKQSTFSILIADIDDFKKVNDNYGHAFGDEVIQRVVAVMEESRDKDNLCARYGGEEFAMILPGKDLEGAIAMGERIRKKFHEFQFQTKQGPRYFTLSIGVAEYKDIYHKASSFFEEADKALYLAKRSGKNRVCSWKEEGRAE